MSFIGWAVWVFGIAIPEVAMNIWHNFYWILPSMILLSTISHLMPPRKADVGEFITKTEAEEF